MEDDFMNDLFGGMFGDGGPPGPGPRGARARRAPRREKGPTSRVELEVSLEELYRGMESGKGKKLEVQRERKCALCKGYVQGCCCSQAPHEPGRADEVGLSDRSGAKPNTKIRPCNKCNGSVCHLSTTARP